MTADMHLVTFDSDRMVVADIAAIPAVDCPLCGRRMRELWVIEGRVALLVSALYIHGDGEDFCRDFAVDAPPELLASFAEFLTSREGLAHPSAGEHDTTTSEA